MLLMLLISATIILHNFVHNFLLSFVWALLDSLYKTYGYRLRTYIMHMCVGVTFLSSFSTYKLLTDALRWNAMHRAAQRRH
jgi:hypothetical protein